MTNKKIRYINILFKQNNDKLILTEPNILKFIKHQPDTIKSITIESDISDLEAFLLIKIQSYITPEFDIKKFEEAYNLSFIRKGYRNADSVKSLNF